MSLQISNLSGRLLTVELNDGQTVHLAPGETSPEIGEADARPNETIERLADRGLIALRDVPEPAAGKPSSSRTRGQTRRR
jgi:hypothetical protein